METEPVVDGENVIWEILYAMLLSIISRIERYLFNPLTTGNANFGSILFLNPQAVGMAVAQDPKCHQGEIQVSSFSLVFLV